MMPVHIAAAWGNPKCLETSPSAGIILKLEDLQNTSERTKNTVLVDHGADINQHDELLCTPMHHAARNGHTLCPLNIAVKNLLAFLETFEWLRDHGADVTGRNLFGQSPADMALANDFPDLADQIRRFGLRKSKFPSENMPGDGAEAQQTGQTDQTDASAAQ
ncbi:hypothetical protein X801_00448 [Opisthorchis viverrini]|nr:hypothetical protein X801_00448 [Opisthorchis viverrini]